jgi:hypothetical protein
VQAWLPELRKKPKYKDKTRWTDTQILADVPLSYWTNKARRLYSTPKELKTALLDWVGYWQDAGYDHEKKLPLFTDRAVSVLKGILDLINHLRVSGVQRCCAMDD